MDNLDNLTLMLKVGKVCPCCMEGFYFYCQSQNPTMHHADECTQKYLGKAPKKVLNCGWVGVKIPKLLAKIHALFLWYIRPF